MRQWLTLWIVCLSLVGCDSQLAESPDSILPGRQVTRGSNSFHDWLNGFEISNADDSNLSDRRKNHYSQSAIYLTLRHVDELALEPDYEGPVPYKLPAELIDFYYNLLVHVYNSNHPVRDTLIVHFPSDSVHPTMSVNLLTVITEDSSSVASRWLSDRFDPRTSELDSLLSSRGLKLRNSAFDKIFWFSVPFPTYLAQIAEEIAAFEGVQYSGPAGFGGDGPDVWFELDRLTIAATYKYGWGDCPLGCIHEHFWYFDISQAGIISNVTSDGDALDVGNP